MPRFLLPALAFASPAAADPDGFAPMMDYGHGYGLMFGPVLWLIVLGLIVFGLIYVVRHLDGPAPRQRQPDAMSELDMRLAKGEIDAEDYAARKKLLAN